MNVYIVGFLLGLAFDCSRGGRRFEGRGGNQDGGSDSEDERNADGNRRSPRYDSGSDQEDPKQGYQQAIDTTMANRVEDLKKSAGANMKAQVSSAADCASLRMPNAATDGPACWLCTRSGSVNACMLQEKYTRAH